MEKFVSITITHSESEEVVLRVDRIGLSKFRLLCFDKNGLPSIYGKLPWKYLKKSYRQWVISLAEIHAGELEAMIKQYRPETTVEEIISFLHDMENDTLKLFSPEIGERNRAVASNMVRELLRAIRHAFRCASGYIVRPKIVWEVSDGGDEVYKILIREGQDES